MTYSFEATMAAQALAYEGGLTFAMTAWSPAMEEAQAPHAAGQKGVDGSILGNMDTPHLSKLLGVPISTATATSLVIQPGPATLTLLGSGFTYDANQQITGGTVTQIGYSEAGGGGIGFLAFLIVPNISAAPFAAWVAADATQLAFATLLNANDTLTGHTGNELIRGYDGDDVLAGMGGRDTLYGGAGDDQIFAMESPHMTGANGTGATYLRGDDGRDVITGGPSFDDINGNMGDDTATGGGGDDWVVGGKDADLLRGDVGADIVYGNIGNDTCDGGAGDDIVRGGQDNDTITGGAGADWLSGDRGSDTVSGGSGADIFHTFNEAGVDRVLDFNRAEGDRVMVDPGTTYTVSQVGADTVIDMGGGNQMVLVGVSMASLTGAWIFGA